MTNPKRVFCTRSAARDVQPQKRCVDIDIERRLRRDLKLDSADIEALDIDLAIEAGLLKPARKD